MLMCPQKYLVPHLTPPTTSAYEDDRDALTAQFDAAATALAEIKAETAAVREAVDAQHAKVEQATADVSAAVAEMRAGDTQTRDALREIRAEVDSVREMLPKVAFPPCSPCLLP
jgi:peroxin-14